MDPILEEIYSTVLTAAPFVIAAYVLIWAILFVFIILSLLSLRNTTKQLSALEEAVAQLKNKEAALPADQEHS